MNKKDIMKAATKCVLLNKAGVNTTKRTLLLLAIANSEGSSTHDLVKDTKYSDTTLVITAKQLEARGLVKVKRGLSKREQHEFSLSAKGRKLVAAIIK